MPAKVCKSFSRFSSNLSQVGFAEREKLQAVILKNLVWNPTSTINIKFLDGTQEQHDKVKNVVLSNLQSLISLKLVFLSSDSQEESQVRISFDPNGGAWSYVGTECLGISSMKATMNLGWLDENQNFAVILHEFMHCLGAMGHEHQSPGADIKWDVDVIQKDLSGTPNNSM